MGYYSIFFANDTIGYVAGEGGTILRSEDAGLTWTKLETGTPTDLWGLYLIDEEEGYAAGSQPSGYSGVRLHTIDGGATWIKQDLPVNKGLYAVFFIDETSGRAAGEWGAMISTIDGGKTWFDYWDPDTSSNIVSIIREHIGRIHPNPAEELLTIETGHTLGRGVEIEVLSITGLFLFKKEYGAARPQIDEQIDLSGHASGTCLVKVKHPFRSLQFHPATGGLKSGYTRIASSSGHPVQHVAAGNFRDTGSIGSPRRPSGIRAGPPGPVPPHRSFR